MSKLKENAKGLKCEHQKSFDELIWCNVREALDHFSVYIFTISISINLCQSKDRFNKIFTCRYEVMINESNAKST